MCVITKYFYMQILNKMKTFKLLFPIFLTLLLALPNAKSQETVDTAIVRIETTDGNEYIGTISSQDADVIQLQTETVGLVTIRKSTVVSMQPVKKSEMRGQRYWFDNPYANTRYFFNTNGYGLPAGEGYYQNAWIVLNQASIGITDHFSIGVGTVPVFLFALGSGDSYTPIWITPKITIPIKKDKINIGIGALHAFVLGADADGSGGLLYGTATFGPKDHNISMGVGWGYATDGGLSDRPTISVSYIKRRNPKWAFLTENYYISVGDDALLILSGGARYMAKKISIDFGGMTFLATGNEQEVFPLIPWLSLSVPFKLKRK
jgi:hypothetical protein